jgi:hypothetical protein
MVIRKGVLRNGHVRAAAVLIVVSCSTGPSGRNDQTLEYTAPSAEKPYGGVAHAAIPDASVEAGADVAMPENPSHISIRLPKVPEVEVVLLSGQAYPYPYTVRDEGDETVVTLYLPQGSEMSIKAVGVEEVGRDSDGTPIYQELGPEVTFTVEPEAKLGTNELEFGGSHTTIVFSGNAQSQLKVGPNYLQGPVTDEFVDGEMRQVVQGVFEAPRDMSCQIDWAGCEMVYSFLDGPPQCHTGPFSLELKAGQRLGLYPVVGGSDFEAVRLDLLDPSAQKEE